MRIPAIFARLLKPWRRSPTVELSPRIMRQMIMGLEQTQPVELSCDEVYELLDLFADMIARGEDAARLMPLVQRHLDMCPDCREEYETLLRSMEVAVV